MLYRDTICQNYIIKQKDNTDYYQVQKRLTYFTLPIVSHFIVNGFMQGDINNEKDIQDYLLLSSPICCFPLYRFPLHRRIHKFYRRRISGIKDISLHSRITEEESIV